MRWIYFGAVVVLAAAVRGADLPAVQGAQDAGGADAARDWRYTLTIQEIAQADDEERLAKLVGDNPDRVKSRLADGRTAVHTAAAAGALKALRVLAKAGADLNDTDGAGQTPLSIAIELHYTTTVKTLLELGADPGREAVAGGEKQAMPPLNIATRLGYADIVAALLDAKADLDQVASDGSTPLTTGAANGRVEAVKFLLGHGAKADAKNQSGQTALFMAIEGNHLEVVKVLLDAKGDVALMVRGDTPLAYAASRGDWDIARVLVEHGAEVNVRDASDGATPLYHAVEKGNAEAVKLLLAHGANATLANNGGATPMAATERGDLWKLLVEKGGNVDEKVNGATPLERFIAAGDLAAVKGWLAYRPNPMITDRKGQTAKEQAKKYAGNAVMGGRVEIARLVESYQGEYFAKHAATRAGN